MTATVDAPPDQLTPVRFHQVGKAFGSGRKAVVHGPLRLGAVAYDVR